MDEHRRAVFIMGSARTGGNTDRLCTSAAEAMEDDGFDVSVFRPFGMHISHCTNCGGCDDTGVCVIDDDMYGIYAAIERSDVIVLCTPVHFSGVSSMLKQVIDRLQCMWTKPRKGERKVLGLIADGGSDPSNFKNITSVCKAVANTLNAEWGGELTFSGMDKVNGITEEQRLKAYGFGRSLCDPFTGS